MHTHTHKCRRGHKLTGVCHHGRGIRPSVSVKG